MHFHELDLRLILGANFVFQRVDVVFQRVNRLSVRNTELTSQLACRILHPPATGQKYRPNHQTQNAFHNAFRQLTVLMNFNQHLQLLQESYTLQLERTITAGG